MKRLLRLITSLFACLISAQAGLASQATLVTPGSPLPMASLASFLNSAFLSVGSCNSGNSAPANGTGGTAFAGECWINTTANPWVFSYTVDGTHWSEFGTLNTSTFVFLPYSGSSPALISGNNLSDVANAVTAFANIVQPSTASGLGGVKSLTCGSHQWHAALSTLGVFTCSQPAIGDISGWGTGVATALGINTGAAGAFVLFNGALGTPTSGTLGSGVSLGGVTMALGSDATGDVYYNNGGVLTRLPKGSNGQALELVAGLPAWATLSGTGTVTNVAAAGLATGGPITTTGTITVTAAVKSDQTAASSTSVAVVPGVQQFHPSAVKAWAHFTGSASNGAQTINSSYNVSSISRTSQGNYTVTFTTAFAAASYACEGSSYSAGSVNSWVQFSSILAGSINENFLNLAGPAAYDPTLGATVVCFGNQ